MTTKEDKTSKPDVVASTNHSISQFRLALWSQLRLQAKHLSKEVTAPELAKFKVTLKQVAEVEGLFGFPGPQFIKSLKDRAKRQEFKALYRDCSMCLRAFSAATYRKNRNFSLVATKKHHATDQSIATNYFEVLFVDDILERDQGQIRDLLTGFSRKQTDFHYSTVFASDVDSAISAVLFNPLIQSVVIRYQVSKKKETTASGYEDYKKTIASEMFKTTRASNLAIELAEKIRELRPELAVYLVTDKSVKDTSSRMLKAFDRIFYRMEDIQELHITLLQDIRERHTAHFFTALQEYSQKPTGVFHAMPISRGNSIFKSWWMRDFGEFYGRNLFLAETSSTAGGLDSLSQPTGPLKKAQQMAAKAYGAERTYFVTNGTSTSNKVVHQGLTQPGDIVLIDRECHKSHHYAVVQSGAVPVYLDSYKIQPFSIYGAVPIATILAKLAELKKTGRLEKVKMLVLTNSTFDGITYNPQMVMEEVLKVKSDIIFLWDEAWFAFASFSPFLRSRTAMYSAQKLREKRDGSSKDKTKDADLKNARIRVYSTQSTHKTLSSFRQGSVIHVFDEDFDKSAENAFHEAYLTHISTSPNYQIIASLDAGRRQAEFEGFELTERAIEMAMNLRQQIADIPLLKKYFRVLSIEDMIPTEFRPNSQEDFLSKSGSWNRMGETWKNDEFALDPTKVTLCVGNTGLDGTTFRSRYLMEQFGIQVNKTSPNTILLMTNIGTTRSSVSYLVRVLLEIAESVDRNLHRINGEEQKVLRKRIDELMNHQPPLPGFSGFHDSFRAMPGVSGGNMRQAFYCSYDETNCEYMFFDDCLAALEKGEDVVSANFVTPYPPGFPVLVPGQLVSIEIINFLKGLDVTEIHGYSPSIGLRLFGSKVLSRHHVPTSFGRGASK